MGKTLCAFERSAQYKKGSLIGCTSGKGTFSDKVFRDSDKLIDLIRCVYALHTDFLIFRIISSVDSLPESVRFYIQNFTYITGHVIIFLLESKFVHKRIWVSQIRWIYGNSKEWQMVR